MSSDVGLQALKQLCRGAAVRVQSAGTLSTTMGVSSEVLTAATRSGDDYQSLTHVGERKDNKKQPLQCAEKRLQVWLQRVYLLCCTDCL
jgi:hypothetical protein